MSSKSEQAVISHSEMVRTLHRPPPDDGGGGALLEAGTREHSQSVDHSGSMEFRFDAQGMVLPHSILGSLEDFRSYLEASGEKELLTKIAETQEMDPWEASQRQQAKDRRNALEICGAPRNLQGNALQHWQTHMQQRRVQQGSLSGRLHRPVHSLLMNKANNFRETQEERELLYRALPSIYAGYGYRVGSEFWTVPQRFGDEVSGIAATLTLTQKGVRMPVTHVGQPNSVLLESGSMDAKSRHLASRSWDQSEYLLQQYQELTDVLNNMEVTKPDIDGLEVIGSGKHFTVVSVSRSPSPEKEEEKIVYIENDPIPECKDDTLSVPALRICGQLATWTGNSNSNQGNVGIKARLNFEAFNGEKAFSNLELRNEGNAALRYTWHQLPLLHSFASLVSQTTSPHFYFKSSPGVILPGETQLVEFVFKSKAPGIKTQLWQLNTHPVLQGGASIQVTLWGVALTQDTTAEQRRAIEMKLEKAATIKMCRPVVYEILQGVRTPERCSSPVELYVPEDEEFVKKNPKLQYHYQKVEDLKRLWQEIHPAEVWDLSVDSLRHAVLSLPDQGSTEDSMNKEGGLARLNALILQLCEPLPKYNYLTATTMGKQLLGKMLDTLVVEATGLRQLLGLPETDTWTNIKDEFTADAEKDDATDKKEAEPTKAEKRGGSSRSRDSHKGEAKSASMESRKRDRKKEEDRKCHADKSAKEQAEAQADGSDQGLQDSRLVDPEVQDKYRRLLHMKVYDLIEDLLDNLCDVVEEFRGGEEREPELWPLE